MGNTIRIKRRLSGSGAPTVGSFANAELAFNEVDNILYYGKGETNNNGIATSIIAIAGDGTFATKTYVDGAVAASAPSGVAYLTASNTFDAAYTNTFNGTVNLEGAFQIDAQAVTTTAAELNFLDGVTSVTGSGALVLDTSPTLVTPILGTPTSGTLTNCDGLPVSTGLSGLGYGASGFLASPSSYNLLLAVTDATGSGSLAYATSPTLVTPVLGTPTSGTLTNCTDLPVTGLSGLGSDVATFLATASSANLASAVTDETGSGALVFATSPTITTSIVAGSASMNIFNTVATTVNAFGVATALSMGASTGTTTINNDLTVLGNLTISGTTTTINSTAISVDDINIILGDTASPSNVTADGGGITLKGATDKTITWVNATAAWTSSEDFNLVTGKVYKINGSQIAASNLINGTTGSGSIVLATSPTLVTPALGTPTAGVLTSCTGLPIGTGISGLGTNVATFLATPTSANFAAAVTDKTGSGVLVFNTSPTLYTPTLGVASATSINKVAITAPATSATITVANGKTFTCNNTMTFTNTNDVSPVEFGTGGTVVYLSAANAFIGANTFTHATGQTFRSAVTQDAIILQGRAGGNSSYAATFTTATLSANRTITFPNETGTVVTTASVCAAIAECTIDGGTF